MDTNEIAFRNSTPNYNRNQFALTESRTISKFQNVSEVIDANKNRNQVPATNLYSNQHIHFKIEEPANLNGSWQRGKSKKKFLSVVSIPDKLKSSKNI